MINDKFGKKRIKFIFSRKSSAFIGWLVCHSLQSKRYKRLAGAIKAGTPYSWNILSVDFESFFIQNMEHIIYSINILFVKLKHAHTHTHLTLANLDSSNVVHRMFSCNAFDTHRHPSTPTDGQCSTQTQPLPLTNAYSAMETDDVNRNNCNLLYVSPSVGVNVCFIHACFKQ